MLYVTTRNSRDVYTAQRVLLEQRGPDGGLYVPFREPSFTAEDINKLLSQSANACIADIINLLFNTHFSSWDIDFSVGRYAVRLNQITSKLFVAECFHNLEWKFSRMVNNLTQMILDEKANVCVPSDWTEIACRIAVLFGIFSDLSREGMVSQEDKIDICVLSGNFSGPISCWYARKWGLPIGNIICCCNENGNLWDFMCHGQLRTNGVAVKTDIPDADIVIPSGLERLIYACGGAGETERYLESVRNGKTYFADDKLLQELRKGFYVTVTGTERVLSMIGKAFVVNRYLMSPYTALCYTGLQDYRSGTGASSNTVLFAEKSPVCDLETIAQACNVSANQLQQFIEKNL